jgi:phospholipase/lecithinase/hemolysin
MLKKLTLLVTLFAVSLNSYAYQFNTVVTFGDSLSDNGNLYRFMDHIIPKSPPYFEGHFSNGPVWIEQLYQNYYPQGKTDNFLDFAVGGAGAVLSYNENLPYTLDAEVTDYLYLHSYNNKNTSLFVVWIGANNYLNGPTNVEDITTSVVDAIGNDIEALIGRGAVMFMVVNLPDMGLTPAAKVANNQALLSELSTRHNQKLLEKYNKLKEQYPNVRFAYYDVNAVFNKVVSSPQQYGFTNVTAPCYDGGFISSSEDNAADEQVQLQNYLSQQAEQSNVKLDDKTKQAILQNPALKEAVSVGYKSQFEPQLTAAAEACTGYVFWDHVHPTTAVHQLISQYAKTALTAAEIQPINQ